MNMKQCMSMCFIVKCAPEILRTTPLSSLQHYYALKKLTRHHFPQITYAQSFMNYHTSNCLEKASTKKPKNVIQFKPKSKQPLIELWKGATLIDIADATKRDLDHVFEALSYIENSEIYEDADMEIEDINVLSAIAKRLGYRVQFVKPLEKSTEKKEK